MAIIAFIIDVSLAKSEKLKTVSANMENSLKTLLHGIIIAYDNGIYIRHTT